MYSNNVVFSSASAPAELKGPAPSTFLLYGNVAVDIKLLCQSSASPQ